MTEMHRSEVETEGRVLTFRVYKAHGQTPRLHVRQTLPPGSIGLDLDESITICEEDVTAFVYGLIQAASAMGVNAVPAPARSNDERYAGIRKVHANAYKPWTPQEDQQLRDEVAAGMKLKEIVGIHGRNAGAISSRIEKLLAGVPKRA
jgi:hypothetical protein